MRDWMRVLNTDDCVVFTSARQLQVVGPVGWVPSSQAFQACGCRPGSIYYINFFMLNSSRAILSCDGKRKRRRSGDASNFRDEAMGLKRREIVPSRF